MAHKIDGPGSTIDNRFTEGAPFPYVAPTTVTAAWGNMVQEEILNVLAAAGIDPDKANNAQLRDAIVELIAAQAVGVGPASTTDQGVVALATAAEVIAGLVVDKAVTPETLAAAIGQSIQVYSAATALTNAVQAYTRQQYPDRVVRTGASGNQAVDCDLHQALYITATGAITMQTPSNVVAEKEVRLRLYSSGAQTISWASGWAGNSILALPTATVAGKWMHLAFVADDDGTLCLVGYSVRA